jgi:two-component system OmpR family sensor kinase
MAAAGEVAVVLEMEEGLRVAVDAEELRLVGANLVQNAIQHSGPGLEVKVVLVRRGLEVELRVEDRGCGIAAEDLPHVFERFYRGDPSRSRSTGGTGLGLAISKAIVGHAGGTISIASTEGKGTTVVVRLPVAM